jgi:hypothetical protein
MYGILFPLMSGNPPRVLDIELYGETNEKDSGRPAFPLADPSISGQLPVSPNRVFDASLVPETCLKMSSLPV